jgi:hypothetical protein
MVPTVVIASIERAVAKRDASGVTLITKVREGAEIGIHFPYELLLDLVAAAAMGRTDCKKHRGMEPNDEVDFLPTAQFELGIERKSGMAVLTFILSNGGRLTFPLSDPAPALMHSFLGAILDGRITKRIPASFLS